MNPHIFREYDIRGVVDVDLTQQVVESLGRGFGSYVAKRGGRRIAIGWDCRHSSPVFADAFMSGLQSTGMTAIEVGMVPTPVLYFTAFRQKTDGAVQITGSHNPPEYNGFKLMLGQDAVYGDQIHAIRQIIQQGDWVVGQGDREPFGDAVGQYIDWVVSNARMGPHKLKIVADAGNGMAGPTTLALLERLGIEVVDMFCDPDGRFPNHHPDPTRPENLALLKERVLAEQADFGVGYDGDADRIGVVDQRGDTLWGDMLMIIYSRDLLRQEPGATIVGEVKCSQTLFDDIAAHGGKPLMWKVGHSLIKAKMKELGALLAGEMSGHIFFKHRFFGFDDAIYSTVRLAEIVSREGRPLSSFLSGIPVTYATPELRLDTGDDATKFEAALAIVKSFEENPSPGVKDIVTVDGIRVVYEDGWGLIRASNTQPVMVLRAEATSEARRDSIEADLRQRVAMALNTDAKP